MKRINMAMYIVRRARFGNLSGPCQVYPKNSTSHPLISSLADVSLNLPDGGLASEHL